MKMIAVFELEFESEDMWDQDSIKKEYKDDWLKAMQYLYESDGLGIFEEELKLIEVKRRNNEN